MIICTGCGKPNDDESRFCAKCGKKLQSSRQPVDSGGDSSAPLTRFKHVGIPDDRWASLKRMVEAWCYLGVLVAVAVGCSFYDTWWPLYPAVGLLAVLLFFRKI